MIFISYRVDDTAKFAKNLAQQLQDRFGADQVFFDKDSIQAGALWHDEIRKAGSDSAVVLVLFGKLWYGPDEEGQRRIDGEVDVFREEIEAALEYGKTLIPVYVERSPLEARHLPDSIRKIEAYQGIQFSTDDFLEQRDVLFQAVAKEIEGNTVTALETAQWPKLKAIESWVPAVTSELIGREGDIEAISSLFCERDKRWVTISGPPCLGKTSLGIGVAQSFLEKTDWMVQWIDVTEAVTSPGLAFAVLQRFVVDTSIFEGEEEQMHERVGELIAGQGNLLLVIDNFEQIADRTQSTLALWLKHAPNLRLLVTSRVFSGNKDAHRFPIKPLAHADIDACRLWNLEVIQDMAGFRLFRSRAEASSGGSIDFEAFSDEEVRTAARIVARCGGFPAPIELAAMSLDIGLDYLEKRLSEEVFEAGPYTEERKLLYLALESLLSGDFSAEERQALFLLSHFSGGFSYEAFEEIISLQTQSHRLLWKKANEGCLIENLKAPSGGMQLRAFYLPIKEYFRARLQSEISEEVQGHFYQRYRNYYVSKAEQFNQAVASPDRLRALRELASIRENVIACIRRDQKTGSPEALVQSILSVSESFFIQGPALVYRQLLEDAFERKSEFDPLQLGQLLRVYARTLWTIGRFPQSDKAIKEAIEISSALGDHIVHALCLRTGFKILNQPRDEELAMANKARETFLRLGDERGKIITGARALTWLGRTEEAFREYEEAYSTAKRLGDPFETAYLLNSWGLNLWQDGQPSKSIEKLNEALEIFSEIENRNHVGGVFTNLGLARSDLDEFETAFECFEQGKELFRSIGNKAWLSVNLTGRARLMARQQRYAEAIEFINENRAEIYAGGYEENNALLLVVEGISLAYLNRYQEGQEVLREALTRFRKAKSMNTVRYYTGSVALAYCLLELNERGRCQQALEEAFNIAKLRRIDTHHDVRYIRMAAETAARIAHAIGMSPES